MKIVLLLTLFTFSFSNLLAQDSDSLELLKDVESKVKNMKKDPLALDKVLRKSVKHYNKSRDKQFMVKLLAFYAPIFKKNQQHYIVEMFFPLFNKNKAKLNDFLDKALTQKEKAEFLERMQLVAREEQAGNG